MKRIINSYLYDTEQADLLHEWEPSADQGDFNYIREALYETKNGAYFITEGESLRPVMKGEAMAWLEAHDGTEALLKHFYRDIYDA